MMIYCLIGNVSGRARDDRSIERRRQQRSSGQERRLLGQEKLLLSYISNCQKLKVSWSFEQALYLLQKVDTLSLRYSQI